MKNQRAQGVPIDSTLLSPEESRPIAERLLNTPEFAQTPHGMQDVADGIALNQWHRVTDAIDLYCSPHGGRMAILMVLVEVAAGLGRETRLSNHLHFLLERKLGQAGDYRPHVLKLLDSTVPLPECTANGYYTKPHWTDARYIWAALLERGDLPSRHCYENTLSSALWRVHHAADPSEVHGMLAKIDARLLERDLAATRPARPEAEAPVGGL